MATVTYKGQTFECTKAVKGTVDVCGFGFIHLLDANDNLLHAFDNVTDFTAFTISGGSWTELDPDDCHLAVVGDDGRVYKSTIKRSNLPSKRTRAMIHWTVTSAVSTANGYDCSYANDKINIGNPPFSSLSTNFDVWVGDPDKYDDSYYHVKDVIFANNECILSFVPPFDIAVGDTITIQIFY